MSAVDHLGCVIVLAGQRPGIDPLCAEFGGEYKALIPIAGQPMIEYPLAAIKQVTKAPVFISGLDIKTLGPHHNLFQAPSGLGPADSALQAAETARAYPVLITTADHALLTPEMITHFVKEAAAKEADFCVGLASKAIIRATYPNTKRTYLKFRDTPVSGCNLFYVRSAAGLEALRFWRQAQHDRKRPLRLARRVGLGALLRYAFGRLTLNGAFQYASKTLGITAKPVLIPIAEAAIDVDKPSDHAEVTAILTVRRDT